MKILSSKDWEKLQHYQYLILVITNRAYLVFYILVLCGMVANIPLILSIFHYFVTFYVALYLVIYYNPYLKLYAKYKFTDLDRKVCYSAGVYILLISFVDYFTFFTIILIFLVIISPRIFR